MRSVWAVVARALKWLLVAYGAGLICALVALLAASVLQVKDVPGPDILKAEFPVGDDRLWTNVLSSGTYVSVVAALLLIVKDFGLGLLDMRSGKVGQGRLRLGTSAAGAVLIGIIPSLVWRPPCPTEWQECSSEQGIHGHCLSTCLNHAVAEMARVTGGVRDAILQDRQRAVLVRTVSSPLLFEDAATSPSFRNRIGATEGGLAQHIESPCAEVFGRGIALRPDHQVHLRRAVAAIKDVCPNTQDVTLRVAPSSSHAPFNGWSQEDSDRLNTRAANCRGEAVEELLRSILRSTDLRAVLVSRRVWKSMTGIKRHTFSGVEYDALLDPGFQSRSVVVRVEDVAECFG